MSDDYCFRHPGRESYVLCQRCTRTVCGECQIAAPVGVVCPECHGADLKTKRSLHKRRGYGVSGERPTATYVLLATIAFIYLGQLLTGNWLTQLFLYWPPRTVVEPWRMVTAIFVHSPDSIFHLLFNGYSLYILGTLVERLVGSGRFLTLFFLSGFGGSVAVLWLAENSAVVGASGAIFGLFGALFVIQRSFGGANPQLLIVLALNLALGFVVPRISWQAHIGGLAIGALVAWIFVRNRDTSEGGRQTTQLGLVGLGLVLATGLKVLL